MKKNLKVKGLQCANCAAKIESSIAKMEGVQSCSLAFMTGKLIIDASEEKMTDILSSIRKLIPKIEPGAALSDEHIGM